MQWVRKAISDTFGHVKTLIAGAIAGGASLISLYLWKGLEMVVSEVPFLVTTVIGAVSGVIVVFLWNLACAPYRLEREQRIETEKRLIDFSGGNMVPLDQVVSKLNFIPIWQAACLLAGISSRREITGVSSHYLTEIKRDIIHRQQLSLNEKYESGEIHPVSWFLMNTKPIHKAIDNLDDTTEITRAEFIEIANRLGRQISGLNA